mmetsp:Transcript_65580/g.202959  ORF Transcript_65580/g.202959 Transcript_65580/m.202959 type:complete len:712 (-) Transcript_65580:339-2474(-)
MAFQLVYLLRSKPLVPQRLHSLGPIVQHGLEDGVPRRVGLHVLLVQGVHDMQEGDRRVVQCPLPLLPGLGEGARHRRQRCGPPHDWQHVDEVTAEWLQAGHVPAVVWHADHHRLLPAALPQLDEERREVRDERREAAPVVPQLGPPREVRDDAVALEGPPPRPRPVQRQVQGPGGVGRELRQHGLGAVQALRDAAPAPEGEVHVLHGQRGQARGCTAQSGLPGGEKCEQLPVEDALGEDVKVHVVQPKEHQHKATWGHKHLGPHRRLLREAEGRATNLPQARERGGLVGHPDDGHRRDGRQNPKSRWRVLRQAREHLVPCEDGLQAGPYALGAHAPRDPHGGRGIVGRAIRGYRLHAQHLLLAEGERIGCALVLGHADVHDGGRPRRAPLRLPGRLRPRAAERTGAVLDESGDGRHRPGAEEPPRGQAAHALGEELQEPAAQGAEALGARAQPLQGRVRGQAGEAQHLRRHGPDPLEERGRGVRARGARGRRRGPGGVGHRGGHGEAAAARGEQPGGGGVVRRPHVDRVRHAHLCHRLLHHGRKVHEHGQLPCHDDAPQVQRPRAPRVQPGSEGEDVDLGPGPAPGETPAAELVHELDHGRRELVAVRREGDREGPHLDALPVLGAPPLLQELHDGPAAANDGGLGVYDARGSAQAAVLQMRAGPPPQRRHAGTAQPPLGVQQEMPEPRCLLLPKALPEHCPDGPDGKAYK